MLIQRIIRAGLTGEFRDTGQLQAHFESMDDPEERVVRMQALLREMAAINCRPDSKPVALAILTEAMVLLGEFDVHGIDALLPHMDVARMTYEGRKRSLRISRKSAKPLGIRRKHSGTLSGATRSKSLLALRSPWWCGTGKARDGVPFHVENDGHRETWPVRSQGFSRWLRHRYFEKHNGAPNNEALQSALGTIESMAQFEGESMSVHRRVASTGQQLYLDLGDPAWRAVEIGLDGWHIIDRPPVRFIRSGTTRVLPEPKSGSSIDALRPYLNLSSDDDFVLAVGAGGNAGERPLSGAGSERRARLGEEHLCAVAALPHRPAQGAVACGAA